MNGLKLKAKMVESEFTLDKLAQLMNMDAGTLSRKINGHSEFKRNEIMQIRELLALNPEEIEAIFFSD